MTERYLTENEMKPANFENIFIFEYDELSIKDDHKL